MQNNFYNTTNWWEYAISADLVTCKRGIEVELEAKPITNSLFNSSMTCVVSCRKQNVLRFAKGTCV